MSSTTTSSNQSESVDLKRLWWYGLLAIMLSVVANNLIGLLTQAIFAVPPIFMPLSPPFITMWTIIGTLGATIVFALLPLRIFQITALIVLLISFIPDIALGITNVMPGTSVPAVISLMVMHIATTLICAGLFWWLIRAS